MFFTQDSVSSILLKDKEYNIKSIPFFGTEKDWKKNSTYIPKEGEIIIYVPENKGVDNTYRIKFGDGINTVDLLEFIYINSSEDIQSLVELIDNNARTIVSLESRINNLTAEDVGADELGAASAALDSAKEYTNQEIANFSGGLNEEQVQSMIDNTQGLHIADKNNPHGVTAAQIGARPDTWMPSVEDIGALGIEEINNIKSEIIQSSQEYTTEQISLAIESIEHPIYVDENGVDSTAETINADALGGRPASEYATRSFVINKITEAQLSGGGSDDIDLSGYATKDDVGALSNLVGDTKVSTQISNAIGAIDFPVDSVNGKTGVVTLSASDVGAADESHSHDDKYYTETEIDSKLNGKSDTSHTHSNYVPTTRSVNNKALSSDITLFASDVGATPLYQKSITNGQTVSFRFPNDSQTCALVTARGWAGTALTSFMFSGYGPGEIRANIHYISGGAGVLVSVNKGSESGHGFSIKANGADLHIGVSVLVGGTPTIETTDANALKLESLVAHPISNGGTGAIDAATARANLGAAPAGYGLGGDGVGVSDANTAVNNGWYYTGESTANLPNWDGAQYATLFVERRAGRVFQTLKTSFTYPYVELTRMSKDGGATWSEWEYVNPPMLLGKEYRTTERYNGKPVYAKVVDIGGMPNTSSKTVYHGVSNIDTAIGGSVFATSEPASYVLALDVTVRILKDAILIETKSNFSNYTSNRVRMYYTKTTD